MARYGAHFEFGRWPSDTIAAVSAWVLISNFRVWGIEQTDKPAGHLGNGFPRVNISDTIQNIADVEYC